MAEWWAGGPKRPWPTLLLRLRQKGGLVPLAAALGRQCSSCEADLEAKTLAGQSPPPWHPQIWPRWSSRLSLRWEFFCARSGESGRVTRNCENLNAFDSTDGFRG